MKFLIGVLLVMVVAPVAYLVAMYYGIQWLIRALEEHTDVDW